MKNRKLSLAVVAVFILLMIGIERWELSNAAIKTARQSKVDFIKDVKPIFQASCYSCHGPDRQRAGLRLDAKKSALRKVIVPGKSSESALYQRIAGIGERARMPLGKDPLKPEQIATIKAWIDQGAEWPEGEGEKEKGGDKEKDDSAIVRHWAYVKPVRPALPEVKS